MGYEKNLSSSGHIKKLRKNRDMQNVFPLVYHSSHCREISDPCYLAKFNDLMSKKAFFADILKKVYKFIFRN